MERSFTSKFIDGEISNKFRLLGDPHPNPTITKISNIARVLCQTNVPEILSLMLEPDFLEQVNGEIDNDAYYIFLGMDHIPRLQGYINAHLLAQVENDEEREWVLREPTTNLEDYQEMTELTIGKIILLVSTIEPACQRIINEAVSINDGLYSLLSKFNVLLIDHFMFYDNYKRLNPDALPAERLSPDHIVESILLHRLCVEKLIAKYSLEDEYTLLHEDDYPWVMDLGTKFEQEMERLCQENGIQCTGEKTKSYYNPHTLSEVAAGDCKYYRVPPKLIRESLSRVYKVDEIIAKVDEYYQLCSEENYHFDKTLWLLSILHYVLTVDICQ